MVMPLPTPPEGESYPEPEAFVPPTFEDRGPDDSATFPFAAVPTVDSGTAPPVFADPEPFAAPSLLPNAKDRAPSGFTQEYDRASHGRAVEVFVFGSVVSIALAVANL